MKTDLYVKEISLSGDIPKTNYLSKLPVINHLKNNKIKLNKPVTFIVGENGTGKSTLIEALAVSLGFNPEGGSRNFNFHTENSHSDLYKYIAVAKGTNRMRDGFFLRAESFYNVATNIERMDEDNDYEYFVPPYVIDAYGGASLHKQSHGESFMSLAENRFGGEGIYILDEPEAALSPTRIMRLMCVMNKLLKNKSQFIISTHSPILMTFPNAEIFEITEDGIRSTEYMQTEHYLVTKRFLENPGKMLDILFEE